MDRVRSALGYGSRSQPATASGSNHTTRHISHHSTPSSSSSVPAVNRGRALFRQRLTPLSSPPAPDSMWPAPNFMVGSGMVILQPSTGKVVLVYETQLKYWFLPKGRKDIGESLEQAALREAYEESGYRVEFLPLFIHSHAPAPPGSDHENYLLPNTEPFYITTLAWDKRWRRHSANQPARPSDIGEYLTFWYVGQIPDGASPEENTGMPDEQHYRSCLLTHDEARRELKDDYFTLGLVETAYTLWRDTNKIMAKLEQEALLDHVSTAGPETEDTPEDVRARR